MGCKRPWVRIPVPRHEKAAQIEWLFCFPSVERVLLRTLRIRKGLAHMDASTFAEIQPEFLDRVSKAVYANMATVDLKNRPRSRIVHPIWENDVAWIISLPDTPKSKHLERNPHVSLAYI